MDLDGVPQWMPDEARQAIDDGALLVDVREDDEWVQARVPGALHVPLSRFAERMKELPRDRPLVLMCHSGQRSHSAAVFLAQRGHPAPAANLVGGIQAWATLGFPLEPGPSK